MGNPKRHLVTAALPYGNGPIHIGHIAGAYLPADIYVRYLRLKGKEVAFICGMDEHGVPITLQARKEGIDPKELVDKYYEIQKNSFSDFGISFDIFHRTTDPTHHKTAQDFFLKLLTKGKFIEEQSEQYFDTEENTFLADRYIHGTCPNCGYEHAYGDQCEKCGSSLSPKELVNPKSSLSGKEPVLRETKHWYLPLDKYEDWLSKWILEDHDDWKPNVYGQCKSWLDQGLKPRAMSRDLDWGVKVPVEGAEGKVLYVWFDAPIGYISATKAWAEERAKERGKFKPGDWEKFWKEEDTELIHFIGKDNIVFHCIIFPTMLKAHGDYILPTNVPANEFLNLEGEKLSTSRGWAVWLNEYLEDFRGKQDILRYVLCANAPETKDNEFTWNDFKAKNDNELVAILGNFVNRVTVLTHKYFDGRVPEAGDFGELENELIKQIENAPAKIAEKIENHKQREALAEMMKLARAGNKYLTETEPWKLWKTDKESTATILYLCHQIIANLSTLCEPFLPFTADKIRNRLNIGTMKWDECGRIDILMPEHKVEKGAYLFEKIDDSDIKKQREKLEKRAKEKAEQEKPKKEPEFKEPIEFDDFLKLDLKVAEIKEAEKVQKADKLLKITLDVQGVERTVVSGIAKYFKPEDIVGKKVTYLSNLSPKKLRGVTSEGMILMAENEAGELSFVKPENDMPSGAIIR